MRERGKILKVVKLLAEVCGGWWGIMSGAISIPFAFLALFWGEEKQKLVFAILAFFSLWVFAIRIARRNYQLLDKLKSNEFPCLGIEGVPCEISSSKKHLCQIRVTSTKTADNVRVELLSLEDDLGEAGKYYRPTFPVVLYPESLGANTINPGSSQKYNLFKVIKGDGAECLNDEMVPYKSFIAYFSEESTKDVITFRWKKNYRMKLRVTARDLPKTEQEYLLNFPCNEGGFCHLQLTPVDPLTEKEKKEIYRSKILEKLGLYQQLLNQRYNQIRSVDYWDYANQNEHFFKLKAFDPETQSLIEEIEVFLQSEIAGATSDFKDTINIQFTRVNPDAEISREKLVYWQGVLDHLKHRTNQLAKIKDRYLGLQ